MHKHPVSQAARPHKPFLKWVGSKSRILRHVVPLLPHGRRLIEPFVGGGAVFLGTDFDEYLLGDSNRDLIEVYQEVSRRPTEFVLAAETLFHERYRTADSYLKVRAAFNLEEDAVARAAQFLYLNRFGFNGLCRYNRSGIFNVPYGHPARVPRLPTSEILAFAEKAARATFIDCDFKELMAAAGTGDVVYCDPPCLDRDDARSFKSYGPHGFDWLRHEELAEIARELAGRGIPVVVSNHDCQAARELYEGAEIHTFSARRSISASGEGRGNVGELIAVFRPVQSFGPDS
ncbi:Dam family site-specific DNA-(adenine-N6)-methyltransferase [Burkholderia sp. Bp8963]|uniref:DNA adenine methylase n=1 Tax=Burkholderia sp. Bp8963 TaxID=2184547 RepID=UPI000F5B4766|nr:Dam family site-specific DNA-(adenine-N6)-methyltransferase [Burkholderia sp. Bp8963]RQS56874.1 Dam family site-specific DNA-(adenine-N6)-methyltransferase [Burkholderia sp. Bp8963]